MPIIELETLVRSDIGTCFDLSRSIDLHQVSTAQTNEKVIAGRMNGLINLNETVTWKATHFGITQKLTTVITSFDRPFHFREQLKGVFKYIIHDHDFETRGEHVIMKDIFRFQSPFGYIGRIFDKLILTAYLKKLLLKRNAVIKEYAETLKWRSVLEPRS
jgi:ligand-binding SRPBCC domain-containing protein